VRARVAEDVRRAKGLVAHDDGARTRHLDALDLVGGHAEARILVEAAEVGGLEVGRHQLQAGVRRDLILLVRRHAPSGLLLRELGRVHQAVRPGGRMLCAWPSAQSRNGAPAGRITSAARCTGTSDSPGPRRTGPASGPDAPGAASGPGWGPGSWTPAGRG